MRGYPIFLNTKEDYLNMIKINPIETVNRLRLLLNDRFDWEWVKDLEDGEDGIEDETHKIESYEDVPSAFDEEFSDVDGSDDGDGSDTIKEKKIIRMQFELRENKHALLFHLGFTVEEIENLIREYGGDEQRRLHESAEDQ